MRRYSRKHGAAAAVGCILLFLIISGAASVVAAKPSNALFSSPATAALHRTNTVESTEIISPWKRSFNLTFDTSMIGADTMRFVQSRWIPSLGFGLPGHNSLVLALPIGITLEPAVNSGGRGGGPGDLQLGLLHQIKEAPRGGIGVLAGIIGSIPTGSNRKLLGEGNFSVNGFVAFSITSFSSSFTINLGYRLRPEHRVRLLNSNRLEQDDDLEWKMALRIPKDEDIAWSLIGNGRIGVATSDGFWPDEANRPLWLGGGIDYPTRNQNRLGWVMSFLVNQPDMGVLLTMQLEGIVKDNDEDRDGVLRRTDQCPVLREDMDGFEDEDGCPDYDNDMDGFPDTEDACPLEPANDFSDDGC